MARSTGTMLISSNIEPRLGAPLDGRMVVPTVADLTAVGAFPYPYKGMLVSTQDTCEVYVYNGGTITDTESWIKIGESSGGSQGGSGDFSLKTVYVGNAGGETTAGITYEDVYVRCDYPPDSYPNGTYYEIINNEYVPAVTPPYTEDQFMEIESRLNEYRSGEMTVEEYESTYGTTPTADEQTLQLMTNFNNYKTFYQKSLPRYIIPEALHGKGEDVLIKVYDIADITDNFNEKIYDDRTYKVATDKSTKYSKGDIIIQLGQYDYEIQIWGHDYIPDASEFPNLLFTKTADGKCSVQKSSTFNTDTIIIPEKVRLNNEIVNVASIPTEGFSNCSSLVTALLPNSIESIGLGAFTGCLSIKSIEIPFVGDRLYHVEEDGVNTKHFGHIFGTTSFGNSSTVQSVYVSEYSNSRYVSTRYYIPTSLTTIVIGGESIPKYSMEGLRLVPTIKLKNTITHIGDYAFMYCNYMTSVVIPNSVTSIGNYAFESCTRLQTVTIPKSVVNLGSNVFLYSGGGSITFYCEVPKAPNTWGSTWETWCGTGGTIIWNYKRKDGYKLRYHYGYEDHLLEVYTLDAGDTIDTFKHNLGVGKMDEDYVNFKLSSSYNYIEQFTSEEFYGGESYEESYYGYNFVKWEDELGNTVNEIPSTMPSRDLEYYADYDEYYYEFYAMDDPGMEG